jgi:hypothetical protein
VSIPQRAAGPALVQAGLAAAIFLLFASLALRHVGESVFLADQADQLQFFERFLRFDPTGLWGPIMSSPDPPTRSLGPLGNWLFGVPVALGFGVDAVQAVTSMLMVLSALAAFIALWSIDSRFAWSWLLLLVGNGIVWWNAGILWANTFMLSAGNLLLAALAAYLRTPTLVRLMTIGLVITFAAHVSLVAVTAIPPAGIVVVRTLRSAWRRRPGGLAASAMAVLWVLAVGPYLLAEAMSGFANSRAILTHAGGTPADSASAPPGIGLAVLQLAADPAWLLQRSGATGWTVVAIGGAIGLASLVVGAIRWRRRGASTATPSCGGRVRDAGADAGLVGGADDAMFWLVLAAMVGIAGQTAFFVLQKRELLSYHYVSMLLPLYAIPPAALAAWVLAAAPVRIRELAAVALGAVCLVVLWQNGRDWADRHFERTPWTFTGIAAAVEELCGAAGSARTSEGAGFDSVMPGHDGVVAFLMRRRLVRCRYDARSDRLIAASREGAYQPVHEERDGMFRLVKVVDPGLALYRREDAAPNQ